MFNLSDTEELLGTADGISAELSERHQALDVVVEANDAAEVFDAHDEAVGHAAWPGVAVTEEERQGALNQSLLPAQVQLPVLGVD